MKLQSLCLNLKVDYPGRPSALIWSHYPMLLMGLKPIGLLRYLWIFLLRATLHPPLWIHARGGPKFNFIRIDLLTCFSSPQNHLIFSFQLLFLFYCFEEVFLPQISFWTILLPKTRFSFLKIVLGICLLLKIIHQGDCFPVNCFPSLKSF